jgi:hypothetical protein
VGVLISVQLRTLPRSAQFCGPASTQECVLAVQMAHWTGMEAIDWYVLDGRANLSVLWAAEGYEIARG